MPDNQNFKARVKPLPVSELYTRCDPALLGFETTAELTSSDAVVGQERALRAFDFGVRVKNDGYHLFVMGRPGSQRHRIVEDFLNRHSAGRAEASDWCYINNFEDERKPFAVRLPAGRGRALRTDLNRLVDDLRGAIPAIFESEQNSSSIAEINEEFEDKIRSSIEALQEQATQSDLSLVSTPHGFAIAPSIDGKLLSDEEFEKLPQEEKDRKTDAIKAMSEKMRKHFEQLPRWQKERRDRIKALQRELVGLAVDQLIAQVKASYAEFPMLTEYFDHLREDVIENAGVFQAEAEGATEGPGSAIEASLSRYEVNLLIDHSDDDRPPILYESNPSIANLLGRVEHIAQFGALITNFTMILPGALHKANGGYLILDADRVLMEPLAWSALKRALSAREIRIESLGQLLSLVSTVSLEPEAIPTDLKVILIGERWVYYLLSAHDPEFSELFKVVVDFEDRIDRSEENIVQYGQLLGDLARSEGLLPLSGAAVARTIEHSARMQGDAEKLTTRLRDVTDVVREANFWAEQDSAKAIEVAHIQKAIDAQIGRLDRVRTEIQEEIRRSTVLIDTAGERIGQINGLAVYEIGNFRFGKPSRITASARIGDGTIVDIERETELGGRIHSKGVLILSAWLRARYATDVPLSITASLVFEQSYGGVEGDSASVAEICALLSAISGVPIRQAMAVTGSVNQHGFAQVIGGVNEKIEGFFDICKARGLTGDQGVLIPKNNVQHLMLREDVIEAVSQAQFDIYPFETVDEAVELLTGVAAGERDASGKFPVDTVNYLVETKLREFAEVRKNFARERTKSGRRRADRGKS
ncbi:MAG: ATP-binding protein [Gammaproteobacteria bacterium]|jgi:lon-related putative ATP-dependent protease